MTKITKIQLPKQSFSDKEYLEKVLEYNEKVIAKAMGVPKKYLKEIK